MTLSSERQLGRCSLCGKYPPVYLRRYSGERLCAHCFNKSIEMHVRRTISKYDLLKPFDRIAVGVSGGKDSLSLLKILQRIERDFPKTILKAVLVDEGIPVYRDESVRIAEEFASSLGVELIKVSFKELFGFTLAEAVESGAAKELGLQPCTICGVLRRKALTLAAKRIGATVVATAHTLDDVVQTYLLNLLRGEARIQSLGLRRGVEGVIPRVAPFRLIPEREVVFYAYLNKIPYQTHTCPYAHTSMRDPIRLFLTSYEERYPGSLYAFLNSFEKMLLTQQTQEEENECEICGEPTNRRICRACEIEMKILEKLRR